ncbi:MAG: cytochrome c [Pseudomonas sp.]|uniref:c-type cytochrome n=1 Tax=Pseudomonas sp. TaxID=306 RepID=UPI00122A3B4C|nr:cytochrome c [Pseudomonas sp.]RZI76942.1 MAG: cytochrome c [Pseudomonas sp.]
MGLGGPCQLAIMRHGVLAICAGAALLSWHAGEAAEPVPPGEAEGVVFERQQIMTKLDEDADKLGKVVAGLLPGDQLAPAARAVAQGARESVEAFKHHVSGGRSKPEVWSSNADFSARMEKFATSAEAMAKAAETGDKAAVLGLMIDALPCKECHDTYREKKRP